MDSKFLKTFVTVAKHKSFTEAAKDLYIAQSAVSKQIRILEDELGVPLFIRESRFVDLTPAGKILYSEAVTILNQIDGAIDKVKQAIAEHSGKLNIGFFSIITAGLSDIIKCFRHFYPNILVNTDYYDFNVLTAGIENGSIDIAFSIAFELMHKFDLNYKTISPGYVSVVLPKDHPLAGNDVLRLSDLQNETYVAFQPDVTPSAHVAMQQYLKSRSFVPRKTVLTRSLESLLIQIQLGSGYTLMADHLFKELPMLRFIPLHEDDKPQFNQIDLVALWNKKNINPCIPIFLGMC